MTTVYQVPFERHEDDGQLTLPPKLCQHLELDDQETVSVVLTSSGVLLKAESSARNDPSIFYDLWAKSVQTLRHMAHIGV